MTRSSSALRSRTGIDLSCRAEQCFRGLVVRRHYFDLNLEIGLADRSERGRNGEVQSETGDHHNQDRGLEKDGLSGRRFGPTKDGECCTV